MILFVSAGLLATLLAYLSQFDKKNHMLFMAFFIIWFIAAFQDAIGVDFASYKDGFGRILNGSVKGSFFRVEREQTEMGWYLLCKGIGTLIPSFYAVTPIVYAFILYSLYRLIVLVPAKWRWLFIFYYYFGVKFFLFDMSGMRQGVAIACWILMALSMKENKYKTALLYVVLGISFHNSFIYSLGLAPLILIPYERNKFYQRKGLWVSIILGAFILVYVYLAQITERIAGLTFLFEDMQNEEVYIRYITEIESHGFSWLGLASNSIMLLFVTIAFITPKSSSPYSSMFYVLFIVFFILNSALGGFGSLPRMLLYVGFFALPAVANTGFHLKGAWRMGYLIFIVFMTFYSFFASLQTEQFIGYMNYHTIFF